jgi:protoheme ferro-lyase
MVLSAVKLSIEILQDMLPDAHKEEVRGAVCLPMCPTTTTTTTITIEISK